MRRKTIEVQMPEELSRSGAAMFIQRANAFQSHITVTKGDKTVNAKSLLGIITIELKNGMEIILQAEGSDEEEALAVLEGLLCC